MRNRPPITNSGTLQLPVICSSHVTISGLSTELSAPEVFIAFALNHPKDTAIVVYCGGEDCDESHELAEKLRKDLGYTNVKQMPGGIVEYRVSMSKPTSQGAK